MASVELIVPADTAGEERFAGEQLMQGMLLGTGLKVEAVQQETAGKIPIRLVRSGNSDPLAMPGEKPGASSREAYHLEISDRSIVISSRSSAGIFYGVQTLRQLIQSEAGTYFLPEVRVDDWPALAYRGTMIDMSEGPIATTDEVLRQLDFLARWKANQFYLYSEDSVELKGYPLLNPQARFSEKDIRRIIDYGRERHIDVVPCLELYGHQHDLFRLERYSELADFPHGGEFDPGNEKAQAVLNDWIAQYAALFPSPFVHIGFDETWEIAQAAERADAKSTPAKLFVKQMNLVAGRFQAAGRTVLAWGDIMVRYPEIVSQLPAGTIVVPWWYEPDPDPTYKHWLQAITTPGIERFVAPGVNGWSELTPDFHKTFRNIDTFLEAGIKANSIGLINTVWTDDQQSLHRMFWPGMAFGAAAAWSPAAKPGLDQFFLNYAQLMYPGNGNGEKLGTAFAQLASGQRLMEAVLGRDTMDRLWDTPFTPEALKKFGVHRQDLHQVRMLAEEAQAAFEETAARESVTLNSFLFGSRLLDYAAMRCQYAVEIDELWNGIGDARTRERFEATVSPGHSRVGDLLDGLSLLLPEYRRNWEAEYRPYRMQTALERWEREYQFWLRVQGRLQRFHAKYKAGSAVPSLDSVAGKY